MGPAYGRGGTCLPGEGPSEDYPDLSPSWATDSVPAFTPPQSPCHTPATPCPPPWVSTETPPNHLPSSLIPRGSQMQATSSLKKMLQKSPKGSQRRRKRVTQNIRMSWKKRRTRRMKMKMMMKGSYWENLRRNWKGYCSLQTESGSAQR